MKNNKLLLAALVATAIAAPVTFAQGQSAMDDAQSTQSNEARTKMAKDSAEFNAKIAKEKADAAQIAKDKADAAEGQAQTTNDVADNAAGDADQAADAADANDDANMSTQPEEEEEDDNQ